MITNKGNEKNYNVRAWLAAKHLVAMYGGKGLHELFAEMPPFEMVKLLLVRAVSERAPAELALRAASPEDRKICRKVMFINVSKTHLYALINADVDAFVDRPPECYKEGVYVRLNYWLYGMWPASKGWEIEYCKRLKAIGFLPGRASPCCFHRESDGVSIVVNGDDFVSEGFSDSSD